MARNLRVGVDTGGTFTDVAANISGAGLTYLKVASTPEDQSEGVIEGVRLLLASSSLQPADLQGVVHGTTVAVNALLERRGARVALLVTKGFRDLVFIGRQQRPALYNWFAQRPQHLVRRRDCIEVDERVLVTGEVLRALEPAHAEEVAGQTLSTGAEAVAICLLHSYANPSHELLMKRAIRTLDERIPVTCSVEIVREFREYERAMTAVANAYVQPPVARYIRGLGAKLNAFGAGELTVMQANGGLMTASTAAREPVRTVLSGPAAGVIGATSVARSAGFSDLISIDMGGTSFDVCLVKEGAAARHKSGELGGVPLRVPMVHMDTLGAGGGSIAWIDAGGGLRVGPRSAGAAPGPACYDRGGTLATVTDANLVLGRLNERPLCGGSFPIRAARSKAAIRERIADPLGVGLEEAAMGVVRVINAEMIRGMRLVSVKRGHDAREFVVVAFGGSGPLHACELARELGVRTVLIPVAPGVLSAVGLLMADFRYDSSISLRLPLSDETISALRKQFNQLQHNVERTMHGAGLAFDAAVYLRTADLKYGRQGHELTVDLPMDLTSTDVRKRFEDLHERTFGYRRPHEDVVIVDVHVSGVLPGEHTALSPLADAGASSRPNAHRDVYFNDGWMTALIVQRARLEPGAQVHGPAVVEQDDTSTLVPPGDVLTVDPRQNLVIAVGAAA